MQFLLVGGLDAELADQGRAGIGRTVDPAEVLLADGAHVAERVHRELAERIGTREARADVDAGEFEAVHGEGGDFLVVEPQPYRHAVEAAVGHHELARVVDVLGGDQPDRGEPLERVGEVGHFLANQLELVRRAVLGDHGAVAIDDQAARRRQRLDAHPVALREIGVVIVPHDLQRDEPREQQHGQRRDDCASRKGALLEEALLLPLVLDADVGGHARQRGRWVRDSSPQTTGQSRPPVIGCSQRRPEFSVWPLKPSMHQTTNS